MRSLSCKDIGCKNDDYISFGQTDQETIDGMMKYLDKKHPRMLRNVSELQIKMRRNLKKVPDRENQKIGKSEEGIELNGE